VRPIRWAGFGAVAAAGLTAAAFASELRISRDVIPADGWRLAPIEPRGATQLGISFRPLQAEALGLGVRQALAALLAHPFQVIRLGAYWSRIEPRPGHLDFSELDAQVEAADRAGKQVILGVGAVKNFGYPEYFVPAHRLGRPLPEGRLVEPSEHRALLEAAVEFVAGVVDRYRANGRVMAWQIEHEAADPLGFEHSWRLSTEFVQREVGAVRRLDPGRPILLNAFLPSSLAVACSQWWRTRGQGDSLRLALGLADVAGIDYYPRHALARVGARTLYLSGGDSPASALRRRRAFAEAHRRGVRVMVTEGQAEPWETETTPPSPAERQPYSCPPEQVIATYNSSLAAARRSGTPLDAYLFWGAEYWLRRERSGDTDYLGAFGRILAES
jgi:hypothetical protein